MGKWLTPSDIPSQFVYRVIAIPDNLGILSAVNGALLELTYVYRWEQFGVVTPVEISDAMNVMFYAYLESSYPMIGAIIPLATEDLPPNVLLCDGSSYNADDYPALFAVLANVFKSGSTFVTPDLRGKTIIGTSGAFAFNSVGGETSHTLTTDELPTHSHTEITAVTTLINGGLEAPASSALPSAGLTGSVGLSQAHNNMQPYRALDYGIIAR